MAGLERRRAQNVSDREHTMRPAVVGTRALGRAGRSSGPGVASLLAVLPADAIVTIDAGDFATLGGAWLPLSQARDVPRADVRRHGLRTAGGDRGFAGQAGASGGGPGR